MSPWYWAPIGLAVLGTGRLVFRLFDFDEEVGWVGPWLLIAAIAWTDCLLAMHTHNPAPAATRVCTAKALEPVYDPSLGHTVPSWVCVGWSEQ